MLPWLIAIATACDGTPVVFDARTPRDALIAGDSLSDSTRRDAVVVDALSVDSAPPTQTIFGEDRPAQLLVPPDYDHTRPLPLLVVLHGYGSSATGVMSFTNLDQLHRQRDVLVIAPEGTVEPKPPMRQFWNATEVCCDLQASGVDDVGYIRALIAEIRDEYHIDPQRIFVFGHSNGGFMAYRLACELDEVAAIASLAGASYLNSTDCTPTGEKSVLQIHGTSDTSIYYTGELPFGSCVNAGLSQCMYPGARASIDRWAIYNQCTGPWTDVPPNIDIVAHSQLPGEDTYREQFAGCQAGISLALWSIADGSHAPLMTDDFSLAVFDWLDAHPRVH